MNIRNLLLGSLAIAGLSTAGAHAADLGVLTSLDVCDNLGLSGLTISSDTNCLQISGGVTYTFSWGDYRSAANYDYVPGNPYSDAGSDGANDFPVAGHALLSDDLETDWESNITAWLKVVASQESDFGTAKAVITLRQVSRYRTQDEGYTSTDSADTTSVGPLGSPFFGQGVNTDSTNGVELQEGFVSIGDSTVITAGLKQDGTAGSITSLGNDTPLNYLGLFGTTYTATGLLFKDSTPILGGASVQLVSDLGNGLTAGVALENIDNTDGHADGASATLEGNNDYTGSNMMNPAIAGTLLGTIKYAGEGLAAEGTVGAIGVLDGDINSWFVHAGATGTFDNFQIRGALAYLSDNEATLGVDNNGQYFQAMLSGKATFDIFNIALSAEYKSSSADTGIGTIGLGTAGPVSVFDAKGWGVGGSVGATVTDGVTINAGARWFHTELDDVTPTGGVVDGDEADSWQAEAQIIAAVTESIKLTGAVGVYGGDALEYSLNNNSTGAGGLTSVTDLSGDDTAFYGSASLAWAPGGGYTASVTGLATSEGAYKTTFTASKTFE